MSCKALSRTGPRGRAVPATAVQPHVLRKAAIMACPGGTQGQGSSSQLPRVWLYPSHPRLQIQMENGSCQMLSLVSWGRVFLELWDVISKIQRHRKTQLLQTDTQSRISRPRFTGALPGSLLCGSAGHQCMCRDIQDMTSPAAGARSGEGATLAILGGPTWIHLAVVPHTQLHEHIHTSP